MKYLRLTLAVLAWLALAALTAHVTGPGPRTQFDMRGAP